jgi:hypothetical protein
MILPIKSGINRPSQGLPVGCLKKVSPYGQKSEKVGASLMYLLFPASYNESPKINRATCLEPWQLLATRRLAQNTKKQFLILDLEVLISPGAHLMLILSALFFTGKNKMSNANQTYIYPSPDAYFLSLSEVIVHDMASTEVWVSEFVGEQQIL